MTAGRSASSSAAGWPSTRSACQRDIRDARREEIEDDLWCQAHEVDPEVDSGDMLGRLVFGLWADIAWQGLEQRHRARVRASPEERNDGHARGGGTRDHRRRGVRA